MSALDVAEERRRARSVSLSMRARSTALRKAALYHDALAHVANALEERLSLDAPEALRAEREGRELGYAWFYFLLADPAS